MQIKVLILFTLLLATATGCSAKIFNSYQYTGEEFYKNFDSIQKSTLGYELDSGEIYLDDVDFYKLNKNTCVIVSKIDGDSGVFGTERILYFYNSKFKDGYIRIFSYTFLDNDESKKIHKIKYIEIIDDLETRNVLREDFNNYLEKMNEAVFKKCS